MEALGDLYREKSKSEKQEILEERRKRLSSLLLKEKKEHEVIIWQLEGLGISRDARNKNNGPC